MRKVLLLLALLATTALQAQTWQEEMKAAQNNLKAASSQMAGLISYIDSAYSHNTALLILLKSSQNAWEKYSEAQIKMRYPSYNAQNYNRHIALCVSNYMTQLINSRIALLQEWKEGIEEGDLCAGSVQYK